MSAKKAKETIPLYDLKLSPAAKSQVKSVLDSGWLSSGPKVRQFEKELAARMKVRYAAGVSSATLGMQLTLSALNPGKQATVVTTPFTFVATIEAILAAGAQPALADIDPHTLNIDPDEVARKMGNHPLAVMPVDIAGHPSDYDTLNAICDQHKVPLVTDAAHAIGAQYRGRTIPGMTDAAVFSFHSTKNLTCGEGGMVLSRHKKLIERIRTLSVHGLTASTYDRKLKKAWSYDVVGFGSKANMSELHASIGLGQLTVFDRDQRQREKLAARYLNRLSELEDLLELPAEEQHIKHGWHLFIIKLQLSRIKISRDRLIRLMAERGIECGVHFKPIFELSYYRDLLGLSDQYFPNAAYAGKRVVSLPLYAGLKLSQVDYICQCLGEIITKHRI